MGKASRRPERATTTKRKPTDASVGGEPRALSCGCASGGGRASSLALCLGRRRALSLALCLGWRAALKSGECKKQFLRVCAGERCHRGAGVWGLQLGWEGGSGVYTQTPVDPCQGLTLGLSSGAELTPASVNPGMPSARTHMGGAICV